MCSQGCKEEQNGCELEGIILNLEPDDSLAHVMKFVLHPPRHDLIVMSFSGKGDKNLLTVAKNLVRGPRNVRRDINPRVESSRPRW